MLAAAGRFSVDADGSMAPAKHTKVPVAPAPLTTPKLQGRGLQHQPQQQQSQQHKQQPPQPPAAARDPLQAFLLKKQQREQQTFAVARRPRVTAAALRADPALTLPTRIPIAARLVVPPPRAQGTDVDVELTLCEMDMAVYHRDPASLPTAAALARRLCAACGGAGTGTVAVRRASELAKAKDDDADAINAGPQLLPAGFIFHQMPPLHLGGGGGLGLGSVLGSVPTNLVHSEPSLLLELLQECEEQGVSEAARVEALRAAVLGMGRSRHHQDMFLELPPAMVPHMGLLLGAFPETPWAFVYHRYVAGWLAGWLSCGHHGVAPERERERQHRSNRTRLQVAGWLALLTRRMHAHEPYYYLHRDLVEATTAAAPADEEVRAVAELTKTAIRHLQSVRMCVCCVVG